MISEIYKYIKNSVLYVITYFLKQILGETKNTLKKNIVFINTGQIGDLMVSSILFDYDEVFDKEVNVYFLLKDTYKNLFSDYKGKINILTYNYSRYKWSLIYRINLLRKLRSLNVKTAINITCARGFLNDEITLLSGAKEFYTTTSNHEYLGKEFGELADNNYTKILFTEIYNEYDKCKLLIKLFFKYNGDLDTGNNKFFNIDNNLQNDYLLLSPVSVDMKRSWGTDNFKILCVELSNKYKIILTGAKSDIEILHYIRGTNTNIFINTCGLDEIAGLVNGCRLFIGNDSGLTHIALKLNKRFVCILDGGYYDMFFPYYSGSGNEIYVFNKLDCFKCRWKCIYDQPLCLKTITVSEVLENIYKSLNTNSD